jgi:uncharacterized protein (DUF2225 family)
MTTFQQDSFICCCCGRESDQQVVMSCSSCGCDLDTRRHHYGFDPIYLYIQQCPSCGYCAYELNEYTTMLDKALDEEEKKMIDGKTVKIKEIVCSETYQVQLKDTSLPQAANKYYCSSLIYEQIGDLGAAASSSHKAAWICDDTGDQQSSDFFRIRTAELFTRVIESNEKIAPGNLASLKLIITDLYRRVGEFEKAKNVLNSIIETNSIEKLEEICEVMINLVQSKNTTVKSFDDYHSLRKSKEKDEPDESTRTQLPF